MSQNPASPVTLSSAPPMGVKLGSQLSIMMFLQYAIWGAWLPILFPFLMGVREFSLGMTVTVLSVGAIGAIIGPFIAGQVADRWFATEKFLGLSHIFGAIVVWQLVTINTFAGFIAFSLIYSIIFSPTLALTNSLAFHHLPDRDRDFGRVRMWGTIGWIAAGITMGHWLANNYTPTKEEAAQKVVEKYLTSDAGRANLLANSQVTLTDKSVLEGKVLENGEKVVVEIAAKDAEGKATTEKKEFKKDEVKSIKPMYAVIAVRGEDGEPVEAIVAQIKAAAERIAADPAQTTAVAAELGKADNFSKAALDGPIIRRQNEGRADAFKLSAILGIIMGIYCFTLPNTPPAKGKQDFAVGAAMKEIMSNPLITLFVLAVPVSCIHQFYFVFTSNYLTDLNLDAPFINKILGVGGGGWMTIGQMSEFFVLALVPIFAKRFSRKTFLALGLLAYAGRMALFAYGPELAGDNANLAAALIIAGIALHGVCFGCFIFVAFMIVDEETSADVRATAQNLFNLVVVGIGIIVGSQVAGFVGGLAVVDKQMNYTKLFSYPMWGALACLAFLLVAYPGGRRAPKHPD